MSFTMWIIHWMKDNCISDHLNYVSFVQRTGEMKNSPRADLFCIITTKLHDTKKGNEYVVFCIKFVVPINPIFILSFYEISEVCSFLSLFCHLLSFLDIFFAYSANSLNYILVYLKDEKKSTEHHRD